MKFAILDDFQGAAASLPCMHQLRGCGELVAFRQPLSSPAQIIEALQDVQILIPIRERTRLAGPVLEALPHLEMISQTGGNAPHLDLEAATRRGIVMNCCTRPMPTDESPSNHSLFSSCLAPRCLHPEVRRMFT